jgi:hypothetical protein
LVAKRSVRVKCRVAKGEAVQRWLEATTIDDVRPLMAPALMQVAGACGQEGSGKA